MLGGKASAWEWQMTTVRPGRSWESEALARNSGRSPPRIAGPPPGTAIGLVVARSLEVARQLLG